MGDYKKFRDVVQDFEKLYTETFNDYAGFTAGTALELYREDKLQHKFALLGYTMVESWESITQSDIKRLAKLTAYSDVVHNGMSVLERFCLSQGYTEGSSIAGYLREVSSEHYKELLESMQGVLKELKGVIIAIDVNAAEAVVFLESTRFTLTEMQRVIRNILGGNSDSQECRDICIRYMQSALYSDFMIGYLSSKLPKSNKMLCDVMDISDEINNMSLYVRDMDEFVNEMRFMRLSEDNVCPHYVEIHATFLDKLALKKLDGDDKFMYLKQIYKDRNIQGWIKDDILIIRASLMEKVDRYLPDAQPVWREYFTGILDEIMNTI